MTEPVFFATPASFSAWLEEHHERATEILVGFFKKSSGLPSITWPESVDQALCFGWIDGVRRRIDDVSYAIRFTPRPPGVGLLPVTASLVSTSGHLVDRQREEGRDT